MPVNVFNKFLYLRNKTEVYNNYGNFKILKANQSNIKLNVGY